MLSQHTMPSNFIRGIFCLHMFVLLLYQKYASNPILFIRVNEQIVSQVLREYLPPGN